MVGAGKVGSRRIAEGGEGGARSRAGSSATVDEDEAQRIQSKVFGANSELSALARDPVASLSAFLSP